MRADDNQVERQIANPLAVEGLVEYHQHSVFREAGYKPCTVSILKPRQRESRGGDPDMTRKRMSHRLHCLVAIASVSHPIPFRTRP